ncbi:MAG TPA: chemotaxis protein CheW [Acidobacteriota bacterium]
MVEARKRAKKKAEEKQAAENDTGSPQAKPVLRSESASSEPVTAYFPVETPQNPEEHKTEPIPAESLPEDQVDYLQKLLMEHPDDEDSQTAALPVPEEKLEVLVFQVGDENYGLDILQIAEIIRFVEPTEIPNTAAYLDGIISLRGRMVPVINGRKRLGHELRMPDRKSRIIVLQDDLELQGILVDSASQVVKLPKANIEPPPAVVVGVDAEFIEGVCEYRNQLVILLRVENFLQIE